MDERLDILKQLIADIENGKYELKEIDVKLDAIPKSFIGNWKDWEEWEPSNEIDWHIKLKAKR